MKIKSWFIVLTTLVLGFGLNNSLGQWGHYPVYTPKGRFIDALTFPEMTQAEIEDQNAFARGEDPTAILLSNSSATYNCHGYTYYMSEGMTPNVWIDYVGQYWFCHDGSFVFAAVQSPTWGKKVNFSSIDHSAVTTGAYGTIISKWGQGPLMQSTLGNSPYSTMGGVTFYVRFDQTSAPEPNPPDFFGVKVVGGDIVLTWNGYNSGDNTNGFHIYKNNSRIFESNLPGTTTWSDVGAVNSLTSTPVRYAVSYWNTNPQPENLSPVIPVSAAPATVSQDTHWSGVVYVGQNASVNSGVTLTINPGAVVQFAPYVSLSANGLLLAQGAAGNRIRMTASNGTWSGLAISGSGANNSVLNFVDIDHVQTYGGSAVNVTGATGLTINNCTISNCTNYGTVGLYLSNAGSPDISSNVITSCGSSGVSFYNTNGSLYLNRLIGNPTGVNCSYSSPMFGKVNWNAYDGNNVITGGGWGVYASSYSNPYVGSNNNSFVGFNSITGNTSGRIYATGTCTITADNNWWGSPSPSSSWFQAVNNSYIEWYPYLYSAPGGNRPTGNPASRGDIQIASGTPTIDTLGSLRHAFDLLGMQNYSQARDTLVSIVRAARSTNSVTQALIGLLRIYAENKDPLIPSLIRGPQGSALVPNGVIQMILGELSRLQGNTKDAATSFNLVAHGYRGTDLGKASLIQLFNMYVAEPTTRSSAIEPLNSLSSDFGTLDPDVSQATWVYNILSGRGTQPSPSSESTVKGKLENPNPDNVPSSYSLSEAYPNPFNPSTTIVFAIPSLSYVSLIVYDVLGREINTLVRGFQDPGYHTVVWSAGSAASGCYYVRFMASASSGGKSFTKVNRLLLLK